MLKEVLGEGIGIAQWSFERKKALREYCKENGKEWKDLDMQLEFLVKELNSAEFFENYKYTFENSDDLYEITAAICWGFERPKKEYAKLEFRQKMARLVLERNVDR